MSRPWGWIEKEKKLQENGSGAWSRGGGRLTGRGDRHHAIRRHIAKVAMEAVARILNLEKTYVYYVPPLPAQLWLGRAC
jgi:hypothetical protein